MADHPAAPQVELTKAIKDICDDAIPLSGDDAGCVSVGGDLIDHARALLKTAAATQVERARE